MRMFKFQLRRDADASGPSCCCCIHVRTGTILLGLWNLVLQMLVVGYVMMVLFSPSFRGHFGYHSMTQDPIDDELVAPVPLSNEESNETRSPPESDLSLLSILPTAVPPTMKPALPGIYRRYKINQTPLTLLISMGCFMITMAMVYGATRHKPAYLIPFFCLQLFDFFLTAMAAFGFFTADFRANGVLNQHYNFPHNQEVELLKNKLGLTSEGISLFMTVFLLLTIILKAYLVNMVWNCYKYLSSTVSVSVAGTSYWDDGESLTYPPKYEEAIKVPPPYEP